MEGGTMDDSGVGELHAVGSVPAGVEGATLVAAVQELQAVRRKLDAAERENDRLREAIARQPDGLAADRTGCAEADLASLRAQRKAERDARIAELAAELKAERDARHERERTEVAELKEALAEQRRREDRLMEALEAAVQAAPPVSRGLAEAPDGVAVSSGLLPSYVASGYP
jgi:chromosome segregation ATPase